jgi:molybdenum cofactor cytidylyltransferase
MKLSRALRLTHPATLSITAIDPLPLARELTPAILTTTTHFDKKQVALANWHIILPADFSSPEIKSRLREGLTLVSGGLEGEYYRGLSPAEMDALRPLAASLKIPLLIATDADQPVPEFVQAVVMDTTLSEKAIPAGARRIALITQAQTTKELLLTFDTVIIKNDSGDYTVREKIAGVILAAGESTRFGSSKQLLDYHGQPFIRQVAQTALDAGLAPVIVVTGAHAAPVEAVIQDLPIVVIRNRAWQNGQGSSIRAGIAAVTEPNTGGVVLLVADQPQVTVHVIGALLERHAAEGAAIVAPLAADRRTNPILFDRDTFPDLLALSGDVGGRAVFSNYKVDYVPWHDESLLFDVNTADDYRKLLAWGVEE